MHVPPGPGMAGGLEAGGVLLVLGLDVAWRGGHVEGPGLVGVDPRHPGVHGLHAVVEVVVHLPQLLGAVVVVVQRSACKDESF